MRLIRLKLKNIASLKGDHEIDFQEIQRISPLFAITGETGSGKSSILNALGLALYGQIYKKNVNQLDVVTLGEKEGSIELIIQVKGKYYLADWKAKVRKQNGELYSTPQTPTRNLYALDAPEFSAHKNIAAVSTTELLNLDFDQFCKCIILNQGEFAKFLTSSFTDRKDILEKLYPGELLESMGRELKLELETLQSAKNEIEIKLGELRGDNFSGEILREQKKELEKELTNLESISKNLETLDYHFVSLFNYHEKFTENERKKELIKKDMAAETTKYNHLLKTGGAVLEKYQKARKDQETELPLLQGYLKKEESLKHLQEAQLLLEKKSQELSKEIALIDEKFKTKEIEEKNALTKLSDAGSMLAHPLEELKKARPFFDSLFESFSEKELLQEELKGKNERLQHLEISGKESKEVYLELESQIKLIPVNVKELEKEADLKKSELNQKVDKKQRAEIKSQELLKQLEFSDQELKTLDEKVAALQTLIKKTKEDLFPLETTLKLQEVLNATEVCVEHALSSNKESCPVCEGSVPLARWQTLKDRLAATDLKSIRLKFDEGSKLLFQASQEEEHLKKKLLSEQEISQKKKKELNELFAERNLAIPSLTEIDQELDALKKQSWKLETLTKEIETKNSELKKTRDMYSQLKLEVNGKEKSLSQKDQLLAECGNKLKAIIPDIQRESIRVLKLEVKNFHTYLELENELTKLSQEKNNLLEHRSKSHSALADLRVDGQAQLEKITLLQSELDLALQGKKASELIQLINQIAQLASDEWARQVEDQKKQELILKDSQGRLYQLEDLTKDYDRHFNQELHTVRELAALNPSKDILKLKDLSLDFRSPRELIIPLKDIIQKEKETFKVLTNTCRMNFASASTKLTEWERIQDKIQLLELKAKDVGEALARKMRLFEVLGKDELRTFVLSLVEENLIHQTNEELQKLCQGRYEIVHQTRSLKMTPEFFILDKFREGGRRKVSTLSGGETFMVSLAMALGLAEMTRGQAEIDSLFIDEGFGTLDQDSLEDVLDMLQQIQTRGLMVGIISHIKSLTHALPVNLVLTKRQDGTSSISVQLN